MLGGRLCIAITSLFVRISYLTNRISLHDSLQCYIAIYAQSDHE